MQKVSKKANWFREFEHEQTFDAENFAVLTSKEILKELQTALKIPISAKNGPFLAGQAGN